MQIQFVAQSGFIINLSNGENICIDLWLDNPINPLTLDQIPQMDYVFITHDHADHDLKSGIEIAKRDNAIFTSSYDITNYAAEQGVENVEKANIGGEYKMGNLTVIQTIAHHSSDIGNPVGFIIETEDGTIYHMGDTGFFNEVEMYGHLYDVDTLMIPIGSRYTMDALQAAHASRLINPGNIIPMHYNTFPKITQDPKTFEKYLKDLDVDSKLHIMKPGDSIKV